ncbi:peptidase inhibitor family I36 protein [Streptomyces sp. NPDC042319]|uniref:peptidase inhibitor family I36 protein n=1 Tax=Streptomyces sp. NPDC042319 TaxID=3154332 RepID=UPI0033E2B360
MRIRRLLFSIAFASGAAAMAVAPADNATAAPSEKCPEGYVCFWTGPNFTGTMTVHHEPGDTGCTAVSGTSARTVFNNHSRSWNFYSGNNCESLAYALAPGDYNSTDRVFSWK